MKCGPKLFSNEADRERSTGSHGKKMVRDIFSRTINITIFDGIPRDSFALVYFDLFQDSKK